MIRISTPLTPKSITETYSMSSQFTIRYGTMTKQLYEGVYCTDRAGGSRCCQFPCELGKLTWSTRRTSSAVAGAPSSETHCPWAILAGGDGERGSTHGEPPLRTSHTHGGPCLRRGHKPGVPFPRTFRKRGVPSPLPVPEPVARPPPLCRVHALPFLPLYHRHAAPSPRLSRRPAEPVLPSPPPLPRPCRKHGQTSTAAQKWYDSDHTDASATRAMTGKQISKHELIFCVQLNIQVC